MTLEKLVKTFLYCFWNYFLCYIIILFYFLVASKVGWPPSSFGRICSAWIWTAHFGSLNSDRFWAKSMLFSAEPSPSNPYQSYAELKVYFLWQFLSTQTNSHLILHHNSVDLYNYEYTQKLSINEWNKLFISTFFNRVSPDSTKTTK